MTEVGPTPEDQASAGHRAGRVLVVEDNIANLVAVRMVEKLGYRANVAANGTEALDPGRDRYDAVLMDCQMPEMDGFEATREIRRREGADGHTPIIAMTASALAGDRERCLAAGMDDYISKPFRADELAAALQRWVPTPRGEAGTATATGAAVRRSPAGGPRYRGPGKRRRARRG